MNVELKGYRSLILVGLSLLALLLGLMINKLFSEYRDLSIVKDTIFTGRDLYQLDAQFADLDITLLELATNENLSKDELQNKIDIVLNKLLFLENTDSNMILGFNEEVKILMDPINQFVRETVSIIGKADEISFDKILI